MLCILSPVAPILLGRTQAFGLPDLLRKASPKRRFAHDLCQLDFRFSDHQEEGSLF